MDSTPDLQVSIEQLIDDKHLHTHCTRLIKPMKYSLQPKRVDKIYLNWLVRACLAEFVGTGLFCILSMSSVVSTGKGYGVDVGPTAARVMAIAFGHGISIALMVATTCGLSGGHINPAVTLSFMSTGRMDLLTGSSYMVSQIVGGLAGGGFVRAIFPRHTGLGAHIFGGMISVGKGFLIEMILTFVLVIVIYGTAVDPRGPKAIAPLCIGLAVFVDHIVGIPLTGPSLNPARTFAAAIWANKRHHQWVYWIAPCLGAVLAGLFYDFVLLYDHRPLEDGPAGEEEGGKV